MIRKNEMRQKPFIIFKFQQKLLSLREIGQRRNFISQWSLLQNHHQKYPEHHPKKISTDWVGFEGPKAIQNVHL